MTQRYMARALAAAAGVALTAPAMASFGLVTDQPGTLTDISATGVTIPATGDDASVSFASSVANALMPSTTLYASTNGTLCTTAFSAYTNTALPTSGPSNLVCAFWDDLYVDGAANIKHQG